MQKINLTTIEKYEKILLVEIFSHLPDQIIWYIAENATCIKYNFNEIIEEENQIVSSFYIVFDGLITQLKNKIETDSINSLQTYGEIELLLDLNKYKHTLQVASNHTHIFKIPKWLFKNILKEYIVFSQSLSRYIASKQNKYNEDYWQLRDEARNINKIIGRFNSLSHALLGDKIIEFKFKLKKNFDPNLLDREKISYETCDIEQAYTKVEDKSEERIRKTNKAGNNNYTKTHKYEEEGEIKTRTQFIEQKAYNNLIENLESNIIRKIRYQVNSNSIDLSIDIFKDKLSSLKIAEFKFYNVEDSQNFSIPIWLKPFIKENVTEKKEYKNKHLAMYGIPNG